MDRIDQQIDRVTSRSRDRTEPTRATLRPASARRAADATPTPKERVTPPSLRSRFRATRSTLSRRVSAQPNPTGPHGHSGIRIGFRFSTKVKYKNLSVADIGSDHFDRWAAIEAGQIPEDDDTKVPPTRDQMDEIEAETTNAIQQWGRQEEAQIRESAEEQRENLNSQANRLEDQAAEIARNDPEQAQTLYRRAQDLHERAYEVYREAQRRMDHVAEQVREQRSEARSRLLREYEEIREAFDARVAQLKAGLEAEMKSVALNAYFHEEQPEIDSVEYY